MNLIKNAMLIDHDNELVKKDVLFNEFGIVEIADKIDHDVETIYELDGKLLLPGLIDVHVHLREPGNIYKESIKTGTNAAARGGFTTIMAMPNVTPFPDCKEHMEPYLQMLHKDSCIDVIPYGCITKGERGRELVDIAQLKQLGIHAFSDDGVGVASDEMMMQAMEKSAEESVMIVAHTEDMNYRRPRACMHEGIRNKQLGYIGIPSACEYEQLRRDLMLVEATKAHYHVCHMSSKESVQLLKDYKEKGCDVSGEVTVHHLLLNEMDVKDDANYKMNPPLRGIDDQAALLQGLKDGVIDMIANDHAPHTSEEKAKGMEEAPFGIVTIEHAFALLYTNLVLTGKITLEQLTYWMSEAPAKRFNLDHKGKIEVGYSADFVIVDLNVERVIDPRNFYSKGKNTPFKGVTCKGWPVSTIARGTIVYKEEKR